MECPRCKKEIVLKRKEVSYNFDIKPKKNTKEAYIGVRMMISGSASKFLLILKNGFLL